MGADWYIQKLHRISQELWGPVFDAAVKVRDAHSGHGERHVKHPLTRADTPALLQKLQQVTKPDLVDDDLWRSCVVAVELLAELDPEATDDQVYDHAAQAVVDIAYEGMHKVGYFRDSYNGNSLFWRLDISFHDYLDEETQEMSVSQAKRFRRDLAAATLQLPESIAELRGMRCECETEEELHEWRQYFVDKRARLLAFVDTAIANEQPIYISY